MATAEELVIRASMRDELSGPIRRTRSEVRSLGREVDQLDRNAGRSSRSLGQMARGVRGVGRNIIGMGLGGAALGISAVGTALGVAGALGVKTAASMQNANVAFSTMLGSGKRAASFLKDLKQFAATTPFEFPELQTAASSLISAGIEANKVIPIMTSLGNATSGMGTGQEGIRRATVALQQMTAAGRITAEDLNQLRDAGIPVFDLLAAATGKSKKEVAALAQAGKLGGRELTQLMKALETGKGLERFNGLMEKQSHTLGGMFSTLKDNVTMGLADAVQPLVPRLTKLLEVGGKVAADVMPKIGAALGTAADKASAFFGHFKDLGGLEAGKELLGNLGRLFSNLGGGMGESGDNAGTLVKAIRAVNYVVDKMADHTTALKLVLIALGIAFGGPVTATLAVGAAFIWAWRKSEKFRTVVKFVITAVIGYYDGLLAGVEAVLHALGKIPGFGWADRAADKVGKLRDGLHSMVRELNGVKDKHATVTITREVSTRYSGKQVPGLTGDTATRRSRGHGGLDRTLALHSRLSGPGIKVSNALVGGGGRGPGSGDHQRGRALDLVGSGLVAYKRRLEQAGGFAEFHGSGPGRHLHGVYPAGDTASSRLGPLGAGTAAGPVAGVIVEAGAITITVHGDASGADKAALKRAVREAIAEAERDRRERS